MIAFVKPQDPIDHLPIDPKGEAHEIPKNEEELQALIQRADSGEAQAACDLGYFYRKLADDKLNFFKSTISAGSPNMRAPFNVDEPPPFLEVVKEEREQAFRYFKKSAEQGNLAALYELSVCYNRGYGTATYSKKGQQLLLEAAERGYASAEYDVGMQFYFGVKDRSGIQIIKRDYQKAVLWLKKSALQGDALAQYYLGLCYEEGRGVEADRETAFFWYQKSAESELLWAMRALGRCYENGLGVEANIKQAICWYEKAAESGDTEAIEALQRITDDE